MHAALNVRAMEAMLAMAFAHDSQCALIAPKSELGRIKYLVNAWLGESAPRILYYGDAIQIANVWITENLSSIPCEIDQCFVPLAHELAEEPKNLPARTLMAGTMPPPTHWFVAWLEKANVTIKWLHTHVTKAFPSEKARLLPESHPMYSQLMSLRYAPRKLVTRFAKFAQERLFIRSDKRPVYMSERQREVAERQLGSDWGSGRIGTPIVPFELSRIQRRYLAQKRLGRMRGFKKFLVLKYRRGGFTTIEQGISYALAASCNNSYVLTLAHTFESTQRIFKMVNTFNEKDPQAPRRIGDSKSYLEFENGSYFFIGAAGGKGASRGDTLARVHGSEVSRWCQGPHQMSQVDEVIAGLSGAASNGEIVLETTPNGHEWFHAAYVDAKNRLNDYYPIFLRWFDDPGNVATEGTYDAAEILETLTEKEKVLIAKHALTISQIAFRREIVKTYGYLAPQEYPEDDTDCFLTSGLCYFDVELLVTYKNRTTFNSTKIHIPAGIEEVFEEPVKGIEYAAGCDTSEGIPGCDPNGVGIVRKDTGAQVAHVHGYFKPAQTAEHAVRLCKKYNNALLGIERENHGHAVLQAVVALGYGRSHLQGGHLYYYAPDRAGWSTNEQSRVELLDGLYRFMEASKCEGIRDQMFIEECLTFRQQSSGKFEADPGSHDDSVMKWAIAYQMRKHKPRKLTLTVLGE